ncbi:MAG: PP2C family protein-serine/threonine phosphatase [Caldilineales bacterium]|nr:PP2C family protein-serine/threonine phosphatase [Caldilineales bacterium]
MQDRIDYIDTYIEKAEEGKLGECTVCHGHVQSALLEMDYTCCVCLEHLSSTEVRRLENELELAQRIQQTLLPREVPDIPGLEIAAYSRPAQFIGGDYFDFLKLDDGRYCLAIADAAGHGISASLHMASVQAMLRAIIPIASSPADVMQRIHDLFIHNSHFSTFVTFFIGIYDPETQVLSYSNAGHNPPVLLRTGDGEASALMLNPTGAVLGLVEEPLYREVELKLESGDLLVLYTDGVTEAVNPSDELFGNERLIECIERDRQRPAQAIVRGIRDTLERFVNDRALDDDTTFVVIKVA